MITSNSPLGTGHVATVPTEYAAFRRIRWGAVFAGTLIALVTMVALNLLGLGIGLAEINPTQEANPFAGLGVGAIIWYVLSSLASLFAGGYVAGKMSGFPKKSNAALHGLLSWGLFTMISLYLFTTAMGRVVSGVGSAISSVTGGITNTVAAAIPDNLDNQVADLVQRQVNQSNLDLSDIRSEAFELLEQTDKSALDPDNLEQDAHQVRNAAQRNADDVATSPYGAGREINNVIDRIQAKGNNVMEAADKSALVNVLVARTDMSESEARRVVNGWGNRLENTAETVQQEVRQFADRASETATEVGGQVADGLATAALLGFAGLLLGALASYFGGAAGRQTDLTLSGTGQSVSGLDVEHKS